VRTTKLKLCSPDLTSLLGGLLEVSNYVILMNSAYFLKIFLAKGLRLS